MEYNWKWYKPFVVACVLALAYIAGRLIGGC